MIQKKFIFAAHERMANVFLEIVTFLEKNLQTKTVWESGTSARKTVLLDKKSTFYIEIEEIEQE